MALMSMHSPLSAIWYMHWVKYSISVYLEIGWLKRWVYWTEWYSIFKIDLTSTRFLSGTHSGHRHPFRLWLTFPFRIFRRAHPSWRPPIVAIGMMGPRRQKLSCKSFANNVRKPCPYREPNFSQSHWICSLRYATPINISFSLHKYLLHFSQFCST